MTNDKLSFVASDGLIKRKRKIPDNWHRQPRFKTVDELDNKIAEYFTVFNSHPTMCGLALHLGFCDRQSLYAYEKDKRYRYSIKTARTRIENFYEQQMISRNSIGSIFWLKNAGWIDKQEVQQTVKMEGVIRLPAKKKLGEKVDDLDTTSTTSGTTK